MGVGPLFQLVSLNIIRSVRNNPHTLKVIYILFSTSFNGKMANEYFVHKIHLFFM
jgi:hypothetical protein